jgi:hypothetical protein
MGKNQSTLANVVAQAKHVISTSDAKLAKIMPNQETFNKEGETFLRTQSQVWDALVQNLRPEQRAPVFKQLLKSYRTIPGLRNLSTWLVEHKEFSDSIPKYENRIAAQLVYVLTKGPEEITKPNVEWGVYWFFTQRIVALTRSQDYIFGRNCSYLQMMFPMWTVWSKRRAERSLAERSSQATTVTA